MPLSDYRDQLWSCYRCNRCKWVADWCIASADFAFICPSLSKYHFSSYSAQGRLDLGWHYLQGNLKLSPKLVQLVYACSLCGGCEVCCTRSLDYVHPLQVLREFRAEIASQGMLLEQHSAAIKSIRSYGNPFFQPRRARASWAAGLELREASRKVKHIYFAGCIAALNPALNFIPRAAVKLLSQLKLNFGVLLDREPCCGAILMNLGAKPDFESHRKQLLEMFSKLDPESIIVSCAGCLSGLSWALEGEYQVIHMVELLESKLDKLKLSKLELKLSYHDPCHLGRYHGIYHQPRSILESIPGIELIELHRIKEHSWCCGAGAGVKFQFPALAEHAARSRIQEAIQLGAQALVTACNYCYWNLTEYSSGFQVLDLVELVSKLV